MNNFQFVYLAPLLLGFLLDLLIGDPKFLPHPIRLIGKMIEVGELAARKLFPKTNKGELAGGAVMTITIGVICLVVPSLILNLAWYLHPILYMAVETLMIYQILAVKSLKKESMKVYKELEKGDLAGARFAVSMIVGRDTEALGREGIIKAAVETVAENTSDGTVAPLLFMAIGGPPLGFFYKAINTMDSMIGYKNDRYLYFGRCAAKLDDVLNFIPARMSAIFMIMGAFFLRLDFRGAVRVFKRDRFNHASPNSAQTEAVCAGALNIQLAGNATYFGKLHEKKTIGDDLRPIVPGDIPLANKLLYSTAWIALIICMAGTAGGRWLI